MTRWLKEYNDVLNKYVNTMGPSPVPPSHSAPCGGQGMLITIIY